MPAPRTIDDLLHCLKASKLAEPGQVAPFVRKLGGQGTPKELAGMMVVDGVLTPFQAQQLLLGRHKNFFIGKYRILEPLGSGGMGKVLLCEHTLMRQRVAMKVLPRQKNDDPANVARFIREAQAAAALDHPNIVRAHDLDCSSDKFLYFIMDYVDGVSLHDLAHKRKGLHPDHAAHYVAQVAAGLQHIHENGLIHRDLKPANLLVDRTGLVKILDLGLALFQNDDDRITERYNDQTLLGTADFISPEQTTEGGQADIRSDIYCLGCTLYFVLTGKVPFDDDLIVQKLIGHQKREPKPIREHRPEVPQELIDIHRKMTAKNPKDRYQTPGELLRDLQPWMQLDVPPPTDQELPQLSKAAQGARNSSQKLRPSSISMRPSAKLRFEEAAALLRPSIWQRFSPSFSSMEGKSRWRVAAMLAAVTATVVLAAVSIFMSLR